MHHTFYGNGKTLCDRPLNTLRKGTYTGLDSLVRCKECIPELVAYREAFPLASSRCELIPNLSGDGFTAIPLMEGGAR